MYSRSWRKSPEKPTFKIKHKNQGRKQRLKEYEESLDLELIEYKTGWQKDEQNKNCT